jgi:hypothetical protein
MNLDGLQPGDVMAVTGKPWWDPFSMAIRAASLASGHPTWINHIVVFHHTDAAGVPWGIEGRPGGVGWADLREYDNHWLRSNRSEIKTPDQRSAICTRMEKLLGVGYDWLAIAEDGLDDLGQMPWFAGKQATTPGAVPQHVVCSSAAAWAYQDLGLKYPTLAYRLCQPYHWYELFKLQGWR